MRALSALLIALPLPLLAGAEPLADVIARVKPSVLAVGTLQPLRQPPVRIAGTGFVVAGGRRALTCHHVVAPLRALLDDEQLVVLVGSGRDVQVRRAEIVALDPDHDAALLSFTGEPVPALHLARERAREGQEVAFTGYPIANVYGLHPVTHRGIVSAVTPIVVPQASARALDPTMIQRLKDGFAVYQLDATAYPGNSGGPLYDPATGAVLGMVSSVFVKRTKEKLLADPSGITFAIPIEFARRLLEPPEPGP